MAQYLSQSVAGEDAKVVTHSFHYQLTENTLQLDTIAVVVVIDAVVAVAEVLETLFGEYEQTLGR